MNVEIKGAAPPRLYSAGGIKLASMLFSTIAGGVMTAQNLKDVNQPHAARIALWSSIAYSVTMVFLSSLLPKSPAGPWLAWPIGLIGGLGLEAYCKRFVPNWTSFPAKSNRKPFLICIAVIVLLVITLIHLTG